MIDELSVDFSHIAMRRSALIPLLLLAAACGGNTTTAPSATTSTTTTTTTTVSAPTVSEVWTSVLPVGGFKFYSFDVGVNGTVNVTFTEVHGQFVPPTVQLGIGIGQPSGTDCSTTQTVNAATSSTAQITTTEAPGTYCARIFDIGNLFAAATFVVQIDHP
jgi:hypothetical protein